MDSHVQCISERIKLGEGQHLDFKHSINDSKKIARSLVAFANSKGGGSLLIGVKDNGSVKGIASDEEYFMVETAAHLFCKPEPHFKYKIWNVMGKIVLEIIVPEGMDKPYLAPDENGDYKAFVRNHDQNLVAGKILKEVWKRTKKGVKGVKIRYNYELKALLDHIQENGSISKNEFVKLSDLKSSVADNILISLILMNIIEIKLSEKSDRFAFTKDFSDNTEENIKNKFLK